MDGSVPSSASFSVGGKCYSKDEYDRSYDEAKAHCKKVGMKLARYDDQTDYEAIMSMLSELTTAETVLPVSHRKRSQRRQ